MSTCLRLIKLVSQISSFFVWILIQSCSNTQIGETLSSSFDQPNSDTSKENLLSKTELLDKGENKLKRTNSNLKKTVNASENRTYKVQKQNKSNKTNKNKTANKDFDANAIPFNPSPYRITIKLSGANPSSPSETVTRALIKAGVRFEVEKIERVNEDQSRGSRF